MKRFLLILTSLALVLTTLPAWGEYDDLLGQAFPDFTFTDTDGQVLTLSELLREKELVVISVFATWCRYCDEEFPLMQQIYEKYGSHIKMSGRYPSHIAAVMCDWYIFATFNTFQEAEEFDRFVRLKP